MANLKITFYGQFSISLGDEIIMKVNGVNRTFSVVNIRETRFRTPANPNPEYTIECELNIVS